MCNCLKMKNPAGRWGEQGSSKAFFDGLGAVRRSSARDGPILTRVAGKIAAI